MALRDIRPYMLSAHIQWLDDSNEAPHILVLNGPGVVFPSHLRDSPSLLFNLSSEAIKNLEIGDDGVTFQGRFQGKIVEVHAPLDAIVAVQNRAATLIVSFASQEDIVAPQGPGEPASPEEPAKRPQLTVVSDRSASSENTEEPTPTRRGLHLVKGPDTPKD